MARRFELNRAMTYGLAFHFWNLFAGGLLLVTIAAKLTPTLQGYYYTFSTLAGMQALIELGLGQVIMQFASHEWAFLTWGPSRQITGEEQALGRLAGLLQFGLRWYAACALLAGCCVFLGGRIFFLQSPTPAGDWYLPWCLLVLVSSLGLLLTPVVTLLEGCNEVSTTWGLRTLQAAGGSLATLGALIMGLGLYSLAIGAAIKLAIAVIVLSRRYSVALAQLLATKPQRVVSWRQEVWPFQWRVAVSWIASFLSASVLTPVIFHYQGAALAGQVGMTIVLANGACVPTLMWIQTRLPLLGSLVAKREFRVLDQLFKKLAALTGAGGLIGAGLGLVFFATLHATGWKLGERVLPTDGAALLLLLSLLGVPVSVVSLYLRAFKREPLVLVTFLGALLSSAGCWYFGSRFTANAAIAAQVAAAGLWTLPLGIAIGLQQRAALQRSLSQSCDEKRSVAAARIDC